MNGNSDPVTKVPLTPSNRQRPLAETAMPQHHAFIAAELTLQAHAMATYVE